MAEKKVYKNKNGNMTIEDFLKIKHSQGIREYYRGHRTNIHPCPPMELIDSHQQCFFCLDCFDYCESQVKEYKDYYKVRKKKYYKKDLEEECE